MRAGKNAGAAAALIAALLAWASPALAAPAVRIGSARFGNTFVSGEPAVLEATVTADRNAPFRGRLTTAITDAYGGYAGATSIRVELPAGGSAVYQAPIVSYRLGHFTMAATLRDPRGRVVAQIESAAGIVPPIDDTDAADSAVGYFTLPDDSELPRAGEIAAQMRRFGIRWIRMTYNWWLDDRPERPDLADPAWLDTTAFEAWTDAFRANGIEVLGVLFGCPRWASPMPEATAPIAGIPTWGVLPPRDTADWAFFVRTMAERLRGRVMVWEIWNEPDIPAFWRAGPAEYVTLLRASADTLTDVDPAVRLLVNLVDRSDPGLAFAEAVVSEAGSVIDVFGFHYSQADAREYAPRLAPDVVIWNTESYGVPRRHISRWLAERAVGVERVFSFIYHTVLDDREQPDFARFGRYPVHLDYTPRADAIALTTLSRTVGSLPLAAADRVGLGFTAYTFAGDAGEIVALADGTELGETWSPRRAIDLLVRLPPGVRRVTMIDLMGNRQLLRARRLGARLRLDGVAAFLLPEPGQSLRGLRVVRSRRASAR